MDKESSFPWIIILLMGFWIYSLYSQNKDLKQKYNDLLVKEAEEVQALNQYNYEVTHAKYQAWTDYQNMGQTLEYLQNY